MKEPRSCLNCNSEIIASSSYCNYCGQKVDNNNLSLKVIGKDFIENYLSLDTRFGRTIYPFLFQPGYLTNRFLEGKRLSFANPFKTYLFISIFFFFTVGLLVDQKITSDKNGAVEISNSDRTKTKTFTKEELLELGEALESIEDLENQASSQAKIDSLLKEKELEDIFKIQKDSNEVSEKKLVKVNESGLGININTGQLKLIEKYRYNEDYSDEQLLDSIESDTLGAKTRFIALQSIKLYRSNQKLIMRFFIGNFSFALLFLIPMLALIFMLFFRKNKMGFVQHLIHSMHIHTFSLFIYSITFLIYYYTGFNFILWAAFIITIVYWYFSLKNVYNRSIIVSGVRLVLSGIVYYFVWALTLTCGLIISFLLF